MQTLTEALQKVLAQNQTGQAQFQNQSQGQNSASGTSPAAQGTQRNQRPWQGRGGRRGNWKPRECWHCRDEHRLEEAKNHNSYTCPYIRSGLELVKQLQTSQNFPAIANTQASGQAQTAPAQTGQTQTRPGQGNPTQPLNWQGLTPTGGQASPQNQ